MPKLSDTACILLSPASQRGGGNLYPLQASLTGRHIAVHMAVRGLLRQGCIEEYITENATAASRSEGNCDYDLRITQAGLRAIGVEPEPAATAADADTAALPIAASSARQTKSALLFELLSRAEGASRTELIAATGWLPHTVRAALTGLRKKGHAVIRVERDGQSCYRIVDAG